MKKIIKEIVVLILTILPIIFLTMNWNYIPNEIPVHFDLNGNPSYLVSKNDFVYFSTVLTVGVYFLLKYLPKIDPKKSIIFMGNKLYILRFIIQLLIATLLIFLISHDNQKFIPYKSYVFGLIGTFYLILGNYFQTVRPNYFIGIRTPWTLSNDEVWKKTHHMAGRIWIAGGFILMVSCVVTKDFHFLSTQFFLITLILAIAPIVYSYLKGQKSIEN